MDQQDERAFVPNSLDNLCPPSEEEAVEGVGSSGSFQGWLEARFREGKGREGESLVTTEEGTHVLVSPPSLSGGVKWDQGAGKGRFTLVYDARRELASVEDVPYFADLDQYSALPDFFRRLHVSTEEGFGWITVKKTSVNNLWVSYTQSCIVLKFKHVTEVSIKVPPFRGGQNLGWYSLPGKAGNGAFSWVKEMELPFDLAEAWAAHKLGSDLHHVWAKNDYSVRYTDNSLFRYGFIKWFTGLGPDPMLRLNKAGCMDADTLELIQGQISQPIAQIDAALLREQERDRLRKVARLDRALSYSELSRYLAYKGEKSSFGWVERMKADGWITVEKAPGGKGIIIKLTPKGKGVL